MEVPSYMHTILMFIYYVDQYFLQKKDKSGLILFSNATIENQPHPFTIKIILTYNGLIWLLLPTCMAFFLCFIP